METMNRIQIIGEELAPTVDWLSTFPGNTTNPLVIHVHANVCEAFNDLSDTCPSLLIVHATRLLDLSTAPWAQRIQQRFGTLLVALSVTDDSQWAVLDQLPGALALPWPAAPDVFLGYVRRGLLVRDYRQTTPPRGTSPLGLYDALLNASADAVFVFSEHGALVQTNAWAEWMFRLTDQTIPNCRITDLLTLPSPFHDDDFRSTSVSRLIRQAPTLEGAKHEVLGRRADGTTFPARATFAAVRDTQPLLYVGVIGDISEHRNVEKRLLESEERYRVVVDAIPDGVLVHCEGKVTYINNAGVQLLGAKTSEELIGQPVIQFIHPSHRITVAERMRRVVLMRETQPPLDEIIVRLDGSEVWLEVTSSPVTYNGKPSALVITRDRSAQRSQDAAELQAQKMETMGTLASGIAHDFNNILGPILGYAELLKLNAEPGGQDISSIDAILTSARRARSLVKTILMFGRRTDGNRSLVNIIDAVAETETLLRPSLNIPVTIQTRIPTDLPQVLADPNQIHQILMNLCTNALGAMEPAGGILTLHAEVVRLDTRQALHTRMQLEPGRYVRINVSDTGHGIDKALIPKIFDPFFTTKEKGKGTGMGLAAVMGIVMSHQGGVDVTSEVGVGTTFSVYLPLPLDIAPTLVPTPAAPVSPVGTHQILLVDDDPQILPLMASFVRTCGFVATTASSATDAIELVAAHPGRFKVVITDQNMPDMLGTNMVRQLRKYNDKLKCIICSGVNDIALATEAQSSGILARISKPFTLAEFREVLERVLAQAI